MSTIKVNNIEPFSGGTVNITGATIQSASYATTANTLTAGTKTITGDLNVIGNSILTNTAPGPNPLILASDGGGPKFIVSNDDGAPVFGANMVVNGTSQLNGSVSVNNTITATQLTLTGGTGTDLAVTGTATFTSNVSSNGQFAAGITNKAYLNSQFIGLINGTTSDEIGFTDNGNEYGISGWAGPSIYANDPTDSYPALIGFQNKADWTDGRVTMLTPVDMKQGLQVTGSVNVTGSILQKFTAPAPGNQIDLMTVEGATANSHPYDYVNLALADYPAYGAIYAGTYLYEAYDSLGYNYGSEFGVGGAGVSAVVYPFGGGTVGLNRLTDQNDGTTRLYQQASLIKNVATSYQISGSVSLKDTMTLAQQATLPAGAVGELAVSASNLYYHNGTIWSQIN